MLISIIIPTHDSCDRLGLMFDFIRDQDISIDIPFEVVLVDDGSTDDTSAIVNRYSRNMPQLRYVYKSRDAVSCRARTRNIGVSNSVGACLLFLDAGVLIPPDFLRHLAARFCSGATGVNLYYVYGQQIKSTHHDMSLLKEVTPPTIYTLFSLLSEHPGWTDVRSSIFRSASNELNRLPAPWSLGWTSALSVSRSDFLRVEGFDEEFLGFGGEDVDFCHRLFKLGVSFSSVAETPVLHLPHPQTEPTTRSDSILRNKHRLHRKGNDISTELLPFYSGMRLNEALSRYQYLHLRGVLPHYEAYFLRQVARQHLHGKERTLTIGFHEEWQLRLLDPSHAFIISPPISEYFSALLPHKTIRCLLGCNTQYPDNYFDTVIVSDFVRMLGEDILRAVLAELTRISNRVTAIFSPKHISSVNRIDGWTWMPLQTFTDYCREVGLLQANGPEMSISNNSDPETIAITFFPGT
jgi:glycosyltransferase involved in cell wall biosynthesis